MHGNSEEEAARRGDGDADQHRRRSIRTAQTLMRLALPLLDAGNELLAAARLQHAIDSLECS